MARSAPSKSPENLRNVWKTCHLCADLTDWASLQGALAIPKQPAFPSLRDALERRQTRREQFLAEMDAVVPWTRPPALSAPHCPKAGRKGGRPPMPPETMLRACFLQNR